MKGRENIYEVEKEENLEERRGGASRFKYKTTEMALLLVT